MDELASVLLLLAFGILATNLVGAGILLALDDDLDFVDAFFLVMTTTTTVGYGNVAPITEGAKLFMAFYQFVPVTLFFCSIPLLLRFFGQL